MTPIPASIEADICEGLNEDGGRAFREREENCLIGRRRRKEEEYGEGAPAEEMAVPAGTAAAVEREYTDMVVYRVKGVESYLIPEAYVRVMSGAMHRHTISTVDLILSIFN